MPNATRRLWSGGLACTLLLFCGIVHAAEASPDELLRQANQIRTSDSSRFAVILETLDGEAQRLSADQLRQLQYLKGWKSAYDGHYEPALRQLRTIAADPADPTLSFRATATLINVLVLSTQYQEAFTELERMLALLPGIKDGDAREQGQGVAAYLYNQVGEYDLAEAYAARIVAENWAGRAACGGGQLQMEALYKSTNFKTTHPESQRVIDACTKFGELAYANFVRTYVAKANIEQNRFDEAIRLLTEHYDEVQQTRYPRLIADFDVLLALAYRQTGDTEQVRRFAGRAIESGVKDQYTEPLSEAYRLLYLLAKERGDTAAALAFHEKYAAADKGYLDDISARQLAYERVKHEALSNRLQIDTLHKENQVLQLQRENNRLYIAMLVLIAAFIAFFAYKTKRSQLHFMKLSRQDGLTGVANRPHFIELAEAALTNSKKMQQEICVVLCDLDHFKVINDEYGHAAGDAALKQVVAACRGQLRANDVFGRVGGEEFGILLPACSLEAARERCEQLRLALAELVVTHEDNTITVSGSFGVESTASSGYVLRQLLANADAALYQAKRAGRNRVVVYDVSVIDAFASMTQTGRLRASTERFNVDLTPQRE